VARLSANRRATLGLGYVPQGGEVFAHVSVADNLRISQLINRTRRFTPEEA
jgi:ABC-type branched-subunit amino acid transport system ATPase component